MTTTQEKGKVLVLVSLTLTLMLMVSLSLPVSAPIYHSPNWSFEDGTLCTVPDHWVMKTLDYTSSPPPNSMYIHDVCENDTHYFNGSRCCWIHSRVVDTDGTMRDRSSWTWIEPEDWINQLQATEVRFYVRDIQATHSPLSWGWNDEIWLGFNDSVTTRQIHIYNNGETLNFHYYNSTKVGADGATWYEYRYPIPADINRAYMKVQIICIAGDWTFYNPSYFADMHFCVDSMEILAPHCLNITTTEGGTTNPTPGSHIYNYGTSATVTAIPSAGFYFNHWELDGVNGVYGVNATAPNPTSVTMVDNHTLKAVFLSYDSFEQFGPRIDNLLMKWYSNPKQEFEDLEQGNIDIVGSPLTLAYYTKWTTAPWNETIQVVGSSPPAMCMAHRRFYGGWQGEGAYWDLAWMGMFEHPELGIGDYRNFWTFMSVHPEGFKNPSTGSRIRWGWNANSPNYPYLNPLYGSASQDWALMNWIYDTLMKANPKVASEYIPWIAYQYTVGTWNNPDNPLFPKSTYVTFKIRDDVYWHDGQKMTIEDFRWMIGTGPGDLIYIINDRGLELPWWYSAIADVHDVQVLDSQTIKIRYNVKTGSALEELGTLPIIPKHIWEPIFNDLSKDPTAHLADPTLTGSGPYRFVVYYPSVGALLTRYNDYFALNPLGMRITAYNTMYGNPKTAIRITLSNYALETTEGNVTVIRDDTSATLLEKTFSIATPIGYGAYPKTVDIVIGSGISPPIPNCTWIRFKLWFKYCTQWWYVEYRIHLWTLQRQTIVRPSWYPRAFNANTIREDVNCDGFTNINDALVVNIAFASKPGDLSWDARADIVTDGFINIKDCVMLGTWFAWPGSCPA